MDVGTVEAGLKVKEGVAQVRKDDGGEDAKDEPDGEK